MMHLFPVAKQFVLPRKLSEEFMEENKGNFLPEITNSGIKSQYLCSEGNILLFSGNVKMRKVAHNFQ